MKDWIGLAVLAWPTTLMKLIVVAFAIVIVSAVIFALRTGRSVWKWALLGFLAVYLPIFWDHIPTVLAHKYYCETEAGFWVYKTPEQWKRENPGVMEGLVANELRTPSTHEGDEDNWTNTFVLNQRINQVSKHQGMLPFYRWKYESALVDSKTNEVLARSVDFYTAQIRAGGGWHGWKFWLSTDHCFSHKNSTAQFGNYINQIKGAQK